MEHANRFFAGVDRDTSPEAMAEGKLRSLVNFRFLKAGGNFRCQHVQGNRHLFSLTQGFVPLGAAEYGGISFIFSVNPATGEGEVGSWPSPDPSGTGGFVHAYAPLMNWTGGIDVADPAAVRLPMRTGMFNFNCSNMMEVEVSISHDGSVDLYFTDNLNPLRSINSGFNVKTGAWNDRRYWTGSLINAINVFFETCPHPVFDTVLLGQAGRWPAGNTIFYARYSTAALDKTSFLAESAPVQVSVNLPADGVITDGDVANTNTGKSVSLTLTGIDPNFGFIEIAFAYYSDDTVEVGLIDKMYATTPGSSTLTITVTGFEDVIDITPDDLILRKDPADVVRSITQYQSVLWGGNWRESVGRNDILQQLAHMIVAKPPAPFTLDTEDCRKFTSDTSLAFGYKDYHRTFDKIGYFRGEPYAFGIVFVLNGGKETKAFPVKGYDAWMDPLASAMNLNGVLRMPSNMQSGYAMQDGPDFINLLAVTFDASGVTIDQWVQDNVCGFYFVRADRKKTLVYQGHVSNAYLPDQSMWDDQSNAVMPGGSDGSVFGHDLWCEFNGFITGQLRGYEVADRANYGSSIAYDHIVDTVPWPHMFGLFSTDHFFSKEATDGKYFLVLQGNALCPITVYGVSGSRVPANLWEQTSFSPGPGLLDETGANPDCGNITLYNVAPAEFSSTGPSSGPKFTSAYAEGGQEALGQGQPMWWYAWKYTFGGALKEYGNRSMKQRRYLGLVDNELGAGTPNLDARLRSTGDLYPVVNVYRSDPRLLDVGGHYQPHSEFYHRISDFIPIGSLPSITGTKFYKGDCFLGRTYHRQTCAMSDHDGENHSGRYLKYGSMFGGIQETACNPSMRDRGTQNNLPYYPAIYPTDPGNMMYENCNVAEADGYNHGYHQVLGLYGRQGNDLNTVQQPTEYPDRIRYSAIKVAGDISDAYRKWNLAAYKDFDPKAGQIMKIGEVGGRLFTVLETGLKIHSVRERGIVGDGQGGSFVIGEGDMLSPTTIDINGTGTQHQFSVVKGASGYYGYDYKSRSIWRYRGGGEVELLSVQKAFKRDVQEISDTLSQHADVLHRIPDAAVCIGGIVGYRDSRFMEVGWTFIYPYATGGRLIQRTLVFSEEMDVYAGERTHYSPFYLNIGTDLYSVNPSGMPVLGSSNPQADFYLHDEQTQPFATYYGNPAFSKLGFVVNNAVATEKVFDAVHLHASPTAPARYRCHTEYQQALLDPFLSIDEFQRPLYKEGAWKVPYVRAVSTDPGQDLQAGSMMRGRWMEVEYEWGTGDDVKASSAVTIFRPSKT